MDRKGITMSVVLATLVLVSLFAAVGSAASVSGTTMAGTGPAISTWFYNGQSNIFAVDSNGALWDTRITPSGGGIWNSLGGVSTSSPAAVSWGNTTRLDVFVRGANGALWHKYYQNGWSKWESLGGRLASGTGPAVSSSSSGKLDVFVQGTDGALWHTSYNNSWSKWESLGGQVAPNTGPAVSGNFIFPLIKLGTHRLFVQGTDHNLWLKSPTGSGWTAWGRIGMPPEALSTASPAAEINATGPTIVGITSTSGNVWYSVHNNDDNWNQWHSVGSPP